MMPITVLPFLLSDIRLPPGILAVAGMRRSGRPLVSCAAAAGLVLQVVERVLDQLAVPADGRRQQPHDVELRSQEQQRRPRDQRLYVAVAVALEEEVRSEEHTSEL